MDRREIKTRQAIRNAFLALRAHKPLERITVRELADRAEISKATFYLHYHDIYDLSESLQEDVIQRILSSVSRPDLFLTEPARFTQELFAAFFAQQSLIDILFSGAQASVLPIRIEQAVKAHIFFDPARLPGGRSLQHPADLPGTGRVLRLQRKRPTFRRRGRHGDAP